VALSRTAMQTVVLGSLKFGMGLHSVCLMEIFVALCLVFIFVSNLRTPIQISNDHFIRFMNT
jgi:hypothetical protein